MSKNAYGVAIAPLSPTPSSDQLWTICMEFGKSVTNFDRSHAASCPNSRRNAEPPKSPALFPNCMHCRLNWPQKGVVTYSVGGCRSIPIWMKVWQYMTMWVYDWTTVLWTWNDEWHWQQIASYKMVSKLILKINVLSLAIILSTWQLIFLFKYLLQVRSCFLSFLPGVWICITLGVLGHPQCSDGHPRWRFSTPKDLWKETKGGAPWCPTEGRQKLISYPTGSSSPEKHLSFSVWGPHQSSLCSKWVL